MTVIRGATTIEKDEPDQIRAAVKELLDSIIERNFLKKDEVMSIVFSSTSDIHSYYPAKAARETGFESCALFSAQEPDIVGGLALCIRIMVFVEKNITVHHVYLHGAKNLRKDITKAYSVAIDGPAGSGKSTIAKRLAQENKILYLDTGAMYRACALKAIGAGVDVADENAVCDVLVHTDVDVKHENGEQRTMLDGVDVSEEIRRPEVSMAASTISRHPYVRMKMVEKQREIASNTSCVLDGRDIGTVVLPNADFKFFLTARPEVRAKRRYDELKAKGYQVDLSALEQELALRDQQDSTRAVSPLKQASDAVLVDTSDMTVEEVVAHIRGKIQEKI